MSHHLAHARLKDRLEQSAEIAGCAMRVTGEASSAWSAAMFMGGLHEVTMTVTGQTGRQWLDCLDEYAIHLPGFVLSKLVVSTVEIVDGQLTATVEAETVMEA